MGGSVQDVFAEILRMSEQGLEGALVVVTDVKGHTPQVLGAKMVVRPDGSLVGTIGGGRVEHVAVERALEVLAAGQPTTVTFQLKAELGMCCGGQMQLYIEPVRAPARLVLFGAGHVAEATAQVAGLCGFHVVVVDERPEWNSAERFPGAVERRVEPHQDVLAGFAFRASDHVVITTHNHDHDREVLERCLRADPAPGYVGMIGSTRKVDKTLTQLRVAGVPEDALTRVHAPIGLDILAETPAEIAVSIVGELVRHRREPETRKKTRGAPVRRLADAKETPWIGSSASTSTTS